MKLFSNNSSNSKTNEYIFHTANESFCNVGSNNGIADFSKGFKPLYPCNYISRDYLKGLHHQDECQQFKAILDKSKNENDIQSYIKQNEKWFIPASIFKCYDFGHHDAYLFPEQKLGSDYVVDYMLLGKNSCCWNIVFVEFENANIEYIQKRRNEVTDKVRAGLTQINDWERWIEKNRDYFFRSMNFDKNNISIQPPNIFYCLVVSRRSRMTDRANELRQQEMSRHNLNIITFDRLVDNISRLENGI